MEFIQKADEIRDYYQEHSSKSLQRRRRIVSLSLLGLANAALMTLKQTGILKKLPDLPHNIFDANFVTSSAKAYEFGLPDAPLASAGYSSIMILSTFGGSRDIKRPAVVDKILFGMVLANAAAAFQYQYNMMFKQKKICLYCISATVINSLMVHPAWKEIQSEFRTSQPV